MNTAKSVFCAALMLLPALAAAANIRCGDRVISPGTTRVEVSQLCGQPAQVDHKTLYKSSVVADRAKGGTESGVSVDVEVWTYNFGPSQLMQRIQFDEKGMVASIESLGYGF